MQSTPSVVVLDETAMIFASGDFDFFNADDLRRAIRDAATAAANVVCVDLAAVTFIDMSAVRAITSEHERLRLEGRGVKLLSPNATVRRLLTAMDVDAHLCA